MGIAERGAPETPMPARKLLVYPAHTALVPDYEAAEAGLRRYIGRQHDAGHGEAGAFIPTGNAVEVPDRAEYRQELHAGCLLAADEETARLVGVKFTPINAEPTATDAAGA